MRFLSLFSGIEAASLAWGPLGWECAGFAEIEPFPCKVLRHRHSRVPNLGDVTRITEMDVAALGDIDVVIFGSPCQDLSVAGKRKGLSGERSGLFFTALRIIHWARFWCGTRFAVWENVPGAFSSNKGRDFAAVVDALSGLDGTPVPPKGWGTEGCAVGPEAMVEWGVLDAQWFGVAQRRRRVFAVADFGNWAGREPILLEPHSMRGDSAPSREAREEAAGGTGSSPEGRCGVDLRNGVLTGGIAGTLQAGRNAPAPGGTPHVLAFGGNNTSGQIPVTPALTANRGCHNPGDFEAGTLLVQQAIAVHGTQDPDIRIDQAHTLGRNSGQENAVLVFDTTQVTSPSNYSVPKEGDPCHPLAAGAHAPAIAFSCKDYGADAGLLSPTLRAMGHSGSHANAGGQVAVAFQVSQSGVRIGDTHATLDASNGSRRHNGVAVGVQVRRLTPRECERLQGVPDDYTLIPWRKKPASECPDGPRYKALGNSMAVPVIRWIGRRIENAALFGA